MCKGKGFCGRQRFNPASGHRIKLLLKFAQRLLILSICRAAAWRIQESCLSCGTAANELHGAAQRQNKESTHDWTFLSPKLVEHFEHFPNASQNSNNLTQDPRDPLIIVRVKMRASVSFANLFTQHRNQGISQGFCHGARTQPNKSQPLPCANAKTLEPIKKEELSSMHAEMTTNLPADCLPLHFDLQASLTLTLTARYGSIFVIAKSQLLRCLCFLVFLHWLLPQHSASTLLPQ